MKQRVTQFLDRQRWLEPAEETLQQGVGAAFRGLGSPGRRLKDFLHGTWLGHPLHSALTDIPIGAWSITAVLDVVDRFVTPNGADRGIRQGADASLGVGIAGAIAAAAAGLTDWGETYGRSRRTGMAHALLNSIALVLYVGSWLLRRRGHRTAGQVTAAAGFGTVLASSWLGGELVYGQAVMVNHTAWQEGPEEWTAVARLSELPQDGMKRVHARGIPVLITRSPDHLYAIAETCSHAGGPLAEGQRDGDVITCPWHGSQYCLKTGALLRGPSTYDQPRYHVRVSDGWVEVREAPAGPAGQAAA